MTYRLVRSERHGQKVRAVTLLNLGRHCALPREQWPELCARLEELLSGQQALLPMASTLAVETAAQRYAALLLARQGERQVAPVTAVESGATAAGDARRRGSADRRRRLAGISQTPCGRRRGGRPVGLAGLGVY